MKIVRSFFAFLGLVALIFGGVWLYGRHILATDLAAVEEWRSLDQTQATVAAGGSPGDWEARGFVPSSLLRSAAASLAETKIILPNGKLIDGRVDGYFRLNVKSADVTLDDAKISAKLKVDAKYEPDRENPWWGAAIATVVVDAVLLPRDSIENNGLHITRLAVVPNSIALEAGFANINLFNIGAYGLASAIGRDETLLRFKDQIAFIEIPSISPKIELDPSIDSSSWQNFGGEGGTNIAVRLKRDSHKLNVQFDRFLTLRGGLWLLGGKDVRPIEEPNDRPTGDQIEERRARIVAQMERFARADDLVELTLSGKILTDFVDKLLSPSPLQISVSTNGTTGTITEALILHSDKILGDVGLLVKPNGDNFAHADLTVNPGKSTWSEKGLSLPLSLSASAVIDLDLHVNPGIGGGIGTDVSLSGGAEATGLTARAAFEQRTTPQGSAIILQPEVPCTPAAVRAYPGPKIVKDFIQIDALGLELDREIGGNAIEPAILVDGLPIVLKIGDDRTVGPNPNKVLVQFPQPFLALTLSPAGVSMTDKSVSVKASASITLRDLPQTEAEMAKRVELKKAMKDGASKVDCKTLTGLKIVGGAATIVDLYKELLYVGQTLKNHEKVAESALKALTDIDPRNTPENLIKFADAAATAVVTDLKHVFDTIAHPPEATAKIGGAEIKAGPVGPTVQDKGGRNSVGPGGIKIDGVCLGLFC